ncbi:MAG: TonB-dependent receptor [Acidobacteria bacterium]|nr:TonB-dependent receptor [Acidobacteriota bacterium]
MKNKITSTFLAAALLLAALPAYSQQGRGTILGTVTDSSGAPAAAVLVRVTNIATNTTFETRTTSEGLYQAPNLAVGDYSVTAELAGFRKVVRTGIQLQVDQRAQVDIRLEVGQVTESIEVAAEAPLVDTSNTSIGKVVDQKRVSELPLNGRNALALTLLTPSVKSNAGPTSSGFADRGIQLSSISINGGPNAMNGQLLDGGNNIQSYIGEVAINPGVDSVEEFKVQSGGMSAEYGFTAGGVINMVTRSGTNQIKGSIYNFFRNDALDARNTFAVTKPPFRYNQFGASVGGPVIKDRTFFFGNWEEYRFNRSRALITSFPTVGQRTGNFSDLFTAAGALIPIYDAFSTQGSGTAATRAIYPGNIIPATQLDPVARAINEFYPLPNRTPTDRFTNANNFLGIAKEIQTMRQYTLKGDHKFSSNNSMFGRYSFFNHKTDNGGGGAALYPNEVVGKRDDDLKNWNVVLSDTHVVSPTIVNELRVGATRGYFPFIVRSFGGGWPQKLGLPSIVPADTFPAISNGLTGFNTGTAGVRGSLNWQFLDQVNIIRGKHSMKIGFDLRLLQGHNLQRSAPSGSFNFAAALTGNPTVPAGTGSAYASFLLGAVSNASVSTHVGESQVSHSISGYFQDDWKISKRFTLNLGLRYDYQSQAVERNNGSTNFDPTCTLPNGLAGCLVFAGVGGQPRNWRGEDYTNFGPRIGFAFDVFGNTKTILRAGYGMMYPSQMWRENYGNANGFAQTTTNYPQNDPLRPAFQLRNGFPSAPVPPQGRALGAAAFLGQNVAYDESNGDIPRIQQFTLSLQQQMFKSWLFEASYAGNLGRGLTAGSYDLNQLDPQFLALGQALTQQVPNPFAGRVPGALGGATISREQSLRPYPYYNAVTVRNPRLGSYNSHLLLLSAEKRFSKGLAFLFSYTGGKIISDSIATPVNFGPIEQASIVGYQNGKFNRAAERSVDPSDVAQRATISLVYELPFGKDQKGINKLIGGWQVNTIGIMQTGIPLVVTGANNQRANRPDSTGKSPAIDNPTAQRWFDTTAFVNPAPFTFGNVGRTIPDVRTPGTKNFDLSFIKNTRIVERFNLQFRTEMFNFMNNVNLGAPNAAFSPGPSGFNQSGNFGVITSARDARTIQLSLKLMF